MRATTPRNCILALLGALAVVAASSMTPALAHDALESSQPANGAKLNAAPSEIVLTFEGEILNGIASVAALNSDGKQVPLTDPTVGKTVVSVPWPTGTPPGSYTVAWRIVGSDAHPISDTFDFSYTSASSTPAAPASSAAAATPDPTPTSTTSSTSSAAPLVVGVGILIGLVVLGGVIALVVRRRRPRL